jgi:hypothetical protein
LTWTLEFEALEVRTCLVLLPFVRLIIHQELKEIVKDLPVETPPDWKKLPPSKLLRLSNPTNVEEAIRYCKVLVEHFSTCEEKCRHMAKAGPFWVLQHLGLDLANSATMPEIRKKLISSTNLFKVSKS